MILLLSYGFHVPQDTLERVGKCLGFSILEEFGEHLPLRFPCEIHPLRVRECLLQHPMEMLVAMSQAEFDRLFTLERLAFVEGLQFLFIHLSSISFHEPSAIDSD